MFAGVVAKAWEKGHILGERVWLGDQAEAGVYLILVCTMCVCLLESWKCCIQ